MARITLFIQTRKETGKIKLRFRLTESRKVQLYHKSEIEADLSDLSKFEPDGTPKKRANFNRKLHTAIKERISLMQSIYDDAVKDGRTLTTDMFEELIDRQLHPDKYRTEEEIEDRTLLFRFDKYINDGLFSDARKAGYRVTYRILERYLIITAQSSITIDEVSPSFLLSFREFIMDEWKYAKLKKWNQLYEKVTRNNFPDSPRAQNTSAIKLKMLQAFFAQLEDADEISKSPFRKMGRDNRQASLREQYVSPVALTFDEVRKIISTEVTTDLQGVKDAFLLIVALGCRISDFTKMSMDNVSVSPEGIPFIRYRPEKTKHTGTTIKEVKTPLVRFALDIIKRTDFSLPVLRNISGTKGFNKRIKELLQICDMNREVEEWSEEEKKVKHTALYEVASTKLGRKTNVTLLSRVQINSTVAGLHSDGSDAVKHYYDQSLQDLFTLMSRAFREETFRVDKELNII